MKIVANITFKSVLQGIKNIKERNEYFKWLDDEGKRLEIAWDCLQLILADKIQASTIVQYWSNNLFNITTKTSKEFQKILNDNLPVCEVCARGGLMLSQIRLGNGIGTDDLYRDSGSYNNIIGFSYDDFINMEREFEYSESNHPYKHNTDAKLANIMCNILVNGNFSVEDKTDYLTIIKN